MENILEQAMEEKTSKKSTKQAEQQPVLTEDFATQMAKAMMQFQAMRDAEYQAVMQAKQLEEEMRLADKSGLASQNFAQQMEEEIARGEYTDFIYYDVFSKKFGKYFSYTISGYQLNFVVGRATRVPNSLRKHVLAKFNPPKTTNMLPMVSVMNENFQTDKATTAQYGQAITDYVDNLVNTDMAKAKYGVR